MLDSTLVEISGIQEYLSLKLLLGSGATALGSVNQLPRSPLDSSKCTNTLLTPEYELVIDGLIPIEDSLFEFLILSPGFSRDERDLIVHQHDSSNWQQLAQFTS